MEIKKYIPFNISFITGKENSYISETVTNKKLSGNGIFTKKCHEFFENSIASKKNLLTTSCTDALEMTAILANITAGDEVIMPTYTFVSTANAFILRGAKVVFVDSKEDHPGMDEDKIEEVINEKTKAIVPVHYAGVACDMDKILAIAKKIQPYSY
jgi:dTDP-4-amino-4,6-dideoxygalactose transaminase